MLGYSRNNTVSKEMKQGGGCAILEGTFLCRETVNHLNREIATVDVVTFFSSHRFPTEKQLYVFFRFRLVLAENKSMILIMPLEV